MRVRLECRDGIKQIYHINSKNLFLLQEKYINKIEVVRNE